MQVLITSTYDYIQNTCLHYIDELELVLCHPILVLAYLLFRCYCYNHYKSQKYYFCYRYRYFHTTLLLNTLLQILSYPGVVELTTQLLILENILWLPLCRTNKFGLNTLPSKTVAISYTCGLSCLMFLVVISRAVVTLGLILMRFVSIH